MRLLMTVKFPHAEFNALTKKGQVGKVIKEILTDAQPEAVYFTEQCGQRSAVMVINVDNVASIPKYAEPWFLKFNADCQFRIAMTPEDLERSGLEELGKKWG